MNEARLAELASLFEGARLEAIAANDHDLEWLIERCKNARDECKFLIHMKFHPKQRRADNG